jgi:diguanylate cyclase (GGDEF)-like protein
MLLASLIAIMALPTIYPAGNPLSTDVRTMVRGLLGMVVIFDGYMLYQHHLHRRLQNALVRQIKIAAEQKALAEAYYELSIIDPLTGLFNRRYSDNRLRSEMSRADRLGSSLMVLVFDLNDFKQVNDSYGHEAGDLVLQEFARSLARSTRGSDFAVRLGGDEFMVVLCDCPPDKVDVVLSRIELCKVTYQGNEILASVSRGQAQYRTGESVEELIARADKYQYEHKSETMEPQQC